MQEIILKRGVRSSVKVEMEGGFAAREKFGNTDIHSFQDKCHRKLSHLSDTKHESEHIGHASFIHFVQKRSY
jgi:hypothetical protein